MGGSPSTTTQIQDIPAEFKPYYTRMFAQGEQAARQAAQPSILSNQPVYAGIPSMGQLGNYGGPWQQAQLWGAPQGVSAQGQQPASGGFGQSNLLAAQGAGGAQSVSSGNLAARPVDARSSGKDLTNYGATPTQAPPGYVGQGFPGPFTAPTHPLEAAGQWGKLQAAGQMGGLGQNLMQMGQNQAAGAYLYPQSNPYLAATMQYAMQPAVEQFMRGTVPMFESQALQSGAYKGSSARDLAAAQLGSDFGRNLMGTTAAMAMQNLERERAIQQGTGSILDQAARLMQLQPELLSQIGAGYRGFDQRMLDEALLRYQEQVQAPYRPIMPLASIIHGGNIGQTFTQMTPQPSPAATGITGALGGAGIGAGVADLAGYGGTAGTAVGGGLGALGGLLGSIL